MVDKGVDTKERASLAHDGIAAICGVYSVPQIRKFTGDRFRLKP